MAPETQHNKVVIQGLWVGDRLPTMQQVSVASFIANGHDFHLYTYAPLAGVPAGTVIKDANEIIPESKVFLNAKHNTYAAFSDFFRYKLLLDKGGWWTDVDMICLRPFDFAEPYVFSSEHDLAHEQTNTGVIKAPRGAALLQHVWDVCESKNKQTLGWAEVGPELLAAAVERFSLSQYVRRAATFCCLPMDSWKAVFEPGVQFRFQRETHAVHLWHEIWRRADCSVDDEYAPGCLYEQFKTVYLRGQNVDSRHKGFRVL